MGQSEFAVADMVDMFVLLIPPAGGDELQVRHVLKGAAIGASAPNAEQILIKTGALFPRGCFKWFSYFMKRPS